jgi:tetratricopeptide (TPR) repeat protein
MADLFAIQDDIAQKIVEALKITLLGEKPVQVIRRYTGNLEAYDLYMKGIYFYNKRGKENLEKALGFFRTAIDIDPNYALAYAWMAETYTVIGSWTFQPPREAFSKAREAAQKALNMDNSLAEAHSALADITYLFDWDWNKAEAEFKEALVCNPKYAIAHSSYAQFLACLGRFEEALKEHGQARELDPLSLMIRSTAGNTLGWMGQYDRAIDELNKVLEMDPHYGPAREYLHQTYLRRFLAEGNYEEALQECQKFDDSLGMGIVYARMGRIAEGQKIAEEFITQSQRDLNDAYSAAILLIALGENDRGFQFLEKAYDYRSRRMVFLKTSAYFDTVRKDPRFLALLKKIGLEN